MVKYGVVGAIALAVLVAATWDGAKSKKKQDELAKGDVSRVDSSDVIATGDVGTTTPEKAPPPMERPQVAEAPPRVVEKPSGPIEEVFEKYQVKKGDTIKSIARVWLGDESLAQELYDFNKARIPDLRHLSSRLTLVFPRSKFAGGKSKTPGTPAPSTTEEHVEVPTTPTVPAGMKKEEKTKPMPASSHSSGSSSGGERKYVVKEGDTLYGIASRELGKGSRWKEIQKVNNLSSESVRKGQTITLPAK